MQTQWASDEALLGKFLYKTYDETDFTNFGNMYNYNGNSAGYTKPNMTVNAHPQSRWWPVTMTKLYSNKCESTILGIISYQVLGFLHLSGKSFIFVKFASTIVW